MSCCFLRGKDEPRVADLKHGERKREESPATEVLPAMSGIVIPRSARSGGQPRFPSGLFKRDARLLESRRRRTREQSASRRTE